MVPLLNIPILSVVFLLLAGILIGHLIWYRDRSDDEATLVDLRGENGELQAALHEHKQAYVELETQLEDKQKLHDQLKAHNFELEQSQFTKQQDLSEINSELARLQQLKDQAFHDLDQERQQRRSLQEALTAAEENALRANRLSDQLHSQIGLLEQQKSEFGQSSGIVDQLRNELSAMTSEREIVMRERDTLLHRLDAGKEDADLISNLQNELGETRTKLRSAESTVQDRERELESIRSANQDQATTIGQTDSEIRQLKEDVDSLRAERDEALAEVEDARKLQEQLESQVKKVEQLVAQRDEALEETAELETRLSSSQLRIDQLSEELESYTRDSHMLQNSHEEAKLELKQENDVLRQKLAALTQEHDAVSQVLIDERTRLSSMESENHRLSTMAQQADEKSGAVNEELRQSLARKQVELDTLRTELEDIASQLSRERHQREHLQSVLHDRQAEQSQFVEERKQFELKLNSLESKNDSLLSQAAELLSLRGEHAATQQRIDDLVDEKEQIRAGADEERAALTKRIDELNRQTSQLTSQLAQVRVEREEQISEMDRLQQVHRSTLAGRMELESTKDTLEQQIRQLQSELDSAREWENSHVELKTRLDRVVLQRDEAMQTHAEQAAALESLQSQIEDLQQQIRQRDEQVATLQGRYEEVQKQIEGHDDLRRTYLQLQTQSNESGDRLRRVTVERDSQRDALRNAENRLAKLEQRAKSNEETIRNLRRERAAVIANARQPSTVSLSSFANHSMPEADSGGRLRRDSVLGMVYTQPPKRKDDLKRISGIAQVLEKKLNAFGVYTYRQVMEWDSVAVAEFSKLLSFRDRIERDDWIGQARNLQYETYGRAA